MNQYTQQEKERLLAITIEDILQFSGKSIEHTSGHLYYSPFREETSQSFHIDLEHNRWYDFGTGEGGGLIDFVCKFFKCSRGQAYDRLSDIKGKINKPKEKKSYFPKKRDSKIVIQAVEDIFTDITLIEYARKRGINAQILNKYCKQVSYYIQGSKTRNTIGFLNNAGGYVFRSPDTKKCTSSFFTTFTANGKHTSGCNKILVFEGFFDFLSYLTLQKDIIPRYDVCVLNSTVNLPSALEFILRHKKIATFFDNDHTGKNALEMVIKEIEKKSNAKYEVYDMSTLYKNYNDLNEYLIQTTIER